MRLICLSITDKNQYYPDRSQELCGEATFKGEAGEVKIRVGNEAAKRIVALCADGIVEAAQELAIKLTRETLEADHEWMPKLTQE